MAAKDLISIPDALDFLDLTGPGEVRKVAAMVTGASGVIEDDTGRRFVYRAPLEVSGNRGNVVAARTLQDESLGPGPSITQPAGDRSLVLTIVDADLGAEPLTGSITVTATFDGVVGAKEVFNLAAGLIQHGMKFCAAGSITAIVVDVDGAEAGDTWALATSLGYLEDHTVDSDYPTELLALQWPIGSIREVNEDASRTFGASTRLVLGTDYIVSRKDGIDRLVRLSSNLPTPWEAGWRANRLGLTAGYFSTAGVPEQLKDECRRLLAVMWEGAKKGRVGVSGASDASGNFTRYLPTELTLEMRARLHAFRRNRFGADTGEADFDEEGG